MFVRADDRCDGSAIDDLPPLSGGDIARLAFIFITFAHR
jgi:hypothetical protein